MTSRGATKKPGRAWGGLGYPGFFLALTLIVMIIIVITTKELSTAIILIGLITNFLIISSQLILLRDRHVSAKSDDRDQQLASTVMVNPPQGAGLEGMAPSKKKESFTGATTAPPGAGPPSFPNIPTTSGGIPTTGRSVYPGAIDFGETGLPVVGDEAPALGHVDWDAAAKDAVPEGNPFDTDRISSPQAAAPCVDDDAIAIYDGDELLAYQARSRNEPERVWAGIYRRKALVSRYVKEELDERENTRWWGAGEV